AGTRSHSNGVKPIAKATPIIGGSRDTTSPAGIPSPIVTAAEAAGTVALVEPVEAPDAPSSSFPLLLPKIVEAEPAAPAEPSAKAPARVSDAATAPVSPPAPAGKAPTETAPATLPPLSLPTLAPATPATVAVPLPVGAPAEFTDTDGTDGVPSLRKPKRPARALRPPVVRPKRAPRVRRVTRVVRHVDSWSIFKVALVFNLFLYGVLLTAGVLLWQVAQNTGTVDNVERFFESFGWEQFDLKGGEIFHNAWVAGLFLVVGLTGLAVLMATLFNLITDLVGGIRVTVLEEEVIAREDRGLGWRRSPRPTVATPAMSAGPDASEPPADVS
ncbi:MAG: DUF3566 domain-containing protein, partial [Ilumatobacteraceae bacterium]